MTHLLKIIAGLALLLLIAHCKPGDGHLRGKVTPSPDGKTWFSVIDNNGGGCIIYFDGKPWPHPIFKKVEIKPGLHSMGCFLKEYISKTAKSLKESAIQFDIPAGAVFQFDYWGP